MEKIKNNNKGGWILTVLALCIVIGITNEIFLPQKSNNISQPSENKQVESPPASTPTQAPETPQWGYFSGTYGIDNKSLSSATIRSLNTISLGSPYSGDNYGHITIREMNGRIDLYLEVDKGQFNGAFMGTKIKVKLDDNKTKIFSCTEPSDHSTGLLFITQPQRLIKSLRTAKKLKIEAEFFQEGPQLFEFDVTGLDLNKIGL